MSKNRLLPEDLRIRSSSASPSSSKRPASNNSHNAAPLTEAAYPMRAIFNGVTEHLTCALCLQLYDNPKNMPACPHTFCAKCILQLPKISINSSLGIHCPQCRRFNILTFTGVEGLQTNLAAQGAIEAIQAKQRKLDQSTSNGSSNSGSNDGVCTHNDDNNQTICPHCNLRFCNVCRFVHMEKLKVEALKLAEQVIKQCEELDASKAADDLQKALDESVSFAELKLNGVVNAMRTAFESNISQQVTTLRESFKKVRAQCLHTQHGVIEHLADQNNLAALMQRRQSVATNSVLSQDVNGLAHFHGLIKARAKAIASLKTLNSCPTPLFEFKFNTEISDILSVTANVGIGSVSVTNDDLLSRETLSVFASLASFNQQMMNNTDESDTNSSKKPAGGDSSPNSSCKPSCSTELDQLLSVETASTTSAFSDNNTSITSKNSQHLDKLTNVTCIVGSSLKEIFIVRYEKDKIAFIDRSCAVVSEMDIESSLSDGAVFCYISYGEGDTLYYSNYDAETLTNGGGDNTKPVTTTLGLVNIKNINEPRVGSKVILISANFSGMAVIDCWQTMLTSSNCSDLTAYMPIDSAEEPPKNYYVGNLGPESYIHGVLSLRTFTCRLLCSSEGRLMIVDAENLPQNKNKKFRCYVWPEEIKLPVKVDARRNPLYVIYAKDEFAVVVGSHLYIFDTRLNWKEPSLLGRFESPDFAGCLAVAVLPPSNSHDTKTNKALHVAIITQAKKVKICKFLLDSEPS